MATEEETTKASATSDEEKADVQQQEEPQQSSGILSDTGFADLGLTNVLVEACANVGWSMATDIQKQVLPEALQGRDIIGLAETGSGKTGAFCLPILQSLLNRPCHNQIAGVILTPTRELALQIHAAIQALGATIHCGSVCVVGGVDRTQQAIALAKFPHMVVATPGRLLDHLRDTKGFHLRHVRYLVLDEADRMLSMDFEQELMEILDQLPATRQTLLFSATMTSQVQKLQRASLKDPVKIQVHTVFQVPQTLQQSYLFVPAKYKDCYVTYLVNEFAGQSILIFGGTCNHVQKLAYLLRNLGFPAIALHGQMSQSQRISSLHKFSSGGRTILVCTDVASRGLDLPNVNLVINYDLPNTGKEYIHRVGRTARAGKTGTALSIVTQYDVEVYQRIEGLLGKKLPEYSTDEETVLILLERVSEAQRLATRELKEQQSSGGGGRRHKKRRSNDDGDENNLEETMRSELRRGYKGGSGGRGGALPNQRGYQHKKKKQYNRRK